MFLISVFDNFPKSSWVTKTRKIAKTPQNSQIFFEFQWSPTRLKHAARILPFENFDGEGANLKMRGPVMRGGGGIPYLLGFFWDEKILGWKKRFVFISSVELKRTARISVGVLT